MKNTLFEVSAQPTHYTGSIMSRLFKKVAPVGVWLPEVIDDFKTASLIPFLLLTLRSSLMEACFIIALAVKAARKIQLC